MNIVILNIKNATKNNTERHHDYYQIKLNVKIISELNVMQSLFRGNALCTQNILMAVYVDV